MRLPDLRSETAWQPLTPPGVAAFAEAPLRRLLLVQAVVGGVVGVAVALLLQLSWFPVIRAAIEKLPEEGRIRHAQLEWHGETPVVLANGRTLAVTVDLAHTRQYRLPADVQVEFGRDSIQFFSLAGYLEVSYPDRWVISVNQPEVQSWWNSREPALFVFSILGSAVAMFLVWAVMSTLYALPATMVASVTRRGAGYREMWKTAGASLMPGALLMVLAMLFYAAGGIDLVQLLFAFVIHLAAGWVYLFLAMLFLPGRNQPRRRGKRNPFAGR